MKPHLYLITEYKAEQSSIFMNSEDISKFNRLLWELSDNQMSYDDEFIDYARVLEMSKEDAQKILDKLDTKLDSDVSKFKELYQVLKNGIDNPKLDYVRLEWD